MSDPFAHHRQQPGESPAAYERRLERMAAESRQRAAELQRQADALGSPDRRVRKRAQREFEREHGLRPTAAEQQAQLECPHCHVKGKVTSRVLKRKKGLSGGKTAGAFFTSGVSMVATGLSRKERATEMHCGNCGTTWDVVGG